MFHLIASGSGPFDQSADGKWHNTGNDPLRGPGKQLDPGVRLFVPRMGIMRQRDEIANACRIAASPLDPRVSNIDNDVGFHFGVSRNRRAMSRTNSASPWPVTAEIAKTGSCNTEFSAWHTAPVSVNSALLTTTSSGLSLSKGL